MTALVDVRFRASVEFADPLELLPEDLRSRVVRISPLSTLRGNEFERIGASRMARWFRLELEPGTDPDRFLAALLSLDAVEIAERAAEPAPPPEPPG